MAGIGTGDRDAFSAWVAQGQDRWLRTAYLMTGDLQRAEDLLQDSLIAVARRWGDLEQGHPDAYLRTCLYHGNASWWRRRREVVVADVVDDIVDPAASTDRRLILMEALSRLTPKQRAVLVLRFFEDMTERAVADVMKVSVGTVKSQTSAALRRVRAQSPELGELLGQEGEVR